MPSGRTRSESSRLAVLAATRELLAEIGYERLGFDQIATRAGVGKQTVYRWWPSKGAVVADAALEGGVAPALEALPDSGSLGDDLRMWLRAWVAQVTTPQGTGLILALAAASSDDQAVADRLYAQFTGPYEQLVLDRLTRAQDAGELRSDADLPLVASTLIGALLYRLLGRQRLPTPTDADALTTLILTGAAAPTPPAVFVEKHGKTEAVMVSPAQYERMLDALEEAEDAEAFDAAMAEEGENIPWAEAKADLGWE